MAHCINNSGARLLVLDAERAEELQGQLNGGLRDVHHLLLIRTPTLGFQLPMRLSVNTWSDHTSHPAVGIMRPVPAVLTDDL